MSVRLGTFGPVVEGGSQIAKLRVTPAHVKSAFRRVLDTADVTLDPNLIPVPSALFSFVRKGDDLAKDTDVLPSDLPTRNVPAQYTPEELGEIGVNIAAYERDNNDATTLGSRLTVNTPSGDIYAYNPASGMYDYKGNVDKELRRKSRYNQVTDLHRGPPPTLSPAPHSITGHGLSKGVARARSLVRKFEARNGITTLDAVRRVPVLEKAVPYIDKHKGKLDKLHKGLSTAHQVAAAIESGTSGRLKGTAGKVASAINKGASLAAAIRERL